MSLISIFVLSPLLDVLNFLAYLILILISLTCSRIVVSFPHLQITRERKEIVVDWWPQRQNTSFFSLFLDNRLEYKILNKRGYQIHSSRSKATQHNTTQSHEIIQVNIAFYFNTVKPTKN